MSEPVEQQIGGNEGGDSVDGIGRIEKERLSTTSVDKSRAINKPLLSKRKDDNQVTCCCFDVFKKRNSLERKECEDRKRGFLYWCVTILAL